MSAPQFTKGPWFVRYEPVLAIVASENHPVIAELTVTNDREDTGEECANANLLAEAPALYALLADCAQHYRMLARFTEVRNIYEIEKATGKRVRKGWREVIGTECEAGQAKVEELLAKARGEQS